ncbi:MAG: hypothetical protein WBQ14_08085 [Gaiellaceae bacterium]
MTRTAFLLALVTVALAVGCGSTTAHSSTKATGGPYSVRDVERAFFQAGVPFQTEMLPQSNPYLRPPAGSALADAVPLPKGDSKSKHVRALLVGLNRATAASEMAYVFDTKKSADEAVRLKPLSTWMESNHPVIRVQKRNVIILAATAGDSGFAQRVRRAIAALS